jgi:lysyl-tRNA synthetase class 2
MSQRRDYSALPDFVQRFLPFHRGAAKIADSSYWNELAVVCVSVMQKDFDLPFEPLDQFEQRQQKLREIAALGFDPYPLRFDFTHTPTQIRSAYDSFASDALQAEKVPVRVAGRIMTLRLHGKAGFAHLQGDGARIQVYVKLDVVGQKQFDLFKLLDMGDIIGVSGHLFRTKTNELTVWVEELTFLTKALLPLPEKWHGLQDVELRYRQRYLDLIANEEARGKFLKRAAVIREIRAFFDARGYIEVETPMMHSIAGGATARPFVTHHNALDIDLFLRIAPELYLKRLVVGGFDRVFEINRNFRNEGLGWKYNPEFTMLEFYEAFGDFRTYLQLTEDLLKQLVPKVCGSLQVKYGEHTLDFSHFERMTMREAIAAHWPAAAGSNPTAEILAQPGATRSFCSAYNSWARTCGRTLIEKVETDDEGILTGTLFELVAEAYLIQPTFIYDFPAALSPLSKLKKDDPSVVERFELFVAGMEIANAFSELNDPIEQERRFSAQIARGGEEAPKQLDLDYIRALCHGLPPTAGEGIGIDRLAMLLTDSHNIREVILFPLLRPAAPSVSSEPGSSESK